MTHAASDLQAVASGGQATGHGSWFVVVSFDLGDWTIGLGFDVVPTTFGFGIGPLSFGVEREEPPPPRYDDLPDWSRTLHRIVICKWKLDVRLEFDLNIWQFGYAMADIQDHGIYLGPFNVQIEYDKLYNEPDSFFFR